MTKELLLYYFEGLDESIIQLNPFIIDSGFEFIRYNRSEFEKKFFSLFTNEWQNVKSQGADDDISDEFLIALVNSRYFNVHEILRKNKYVVFLIDTRLKKNINDTDLDEIDDCLKNLIAKLKLFKSGHIKLISSFDISEKEEEWHFSVFPTVYASPSKEKVTYSRYSLKDIDLRELEYFKDNLEIPPYLELAFNSFMEYYNIEDEKINLYY